MNTPSFTKIHEFACFHKGGEKVVKAGLPRVAASGDLEALGDDRFLAQWPSDDQAGLLVWLKRNGMRLGGISAQYFLRRVGWDGFILSRILSFTVGHQAGI